jgi:two-component system, OmpR family, sensor kinase
LRRPPIRLRLALAFAGVMAIVLAATGLFLYLHLRSDLDGGLDRGLRARAGDVGALVAQADTGLRDAAATGRAGSSGDFAQILTADGRVFDATAGVSRRPLLTRAQRRAARRGAVSVARARAPGTGPPVRLLATPVRAQGRRLVIIVGVSLAARDQALADLGTLLLLGGTGALVLASLAGYGLAAAALHPVEAMRRRAASISSDRLHERLPLGRGHDELHRLGTTLNEMLARLQDGLERQRSFTADASHELRTPLTMLRTELELIARDRPTGAELTGAVGAAVDEAERLSRLIDDLLLVARAESDQLALDPKDVAVADVLEAVRARYMQHGRQRLITVAVPDGLVVRADPARLRQALGNLVDNALRYGESPIHLEAVALEGSVELHVTDAGPGFPPWFLARALDRFTRADQGRADGGAGLGLAIVQAIARGHGGEARVANATDRGADVAISIPTARSGTVQDAQGMLGGRMPLRWSRRHPPRAVLTVAALAASALLPASASAAVPRFGHVFLIVGENTSYAQITPRHAPFLTATVKPQGAWVTNDHSFTASSSLGEYVAMVSGQYTRCEGQNALPDHCHQRAPSLFAQLAASGRSWRDWEESMTNACDPIDSGAAWAGNIYSAHHNPGLYFTALQGGRVDEAIVPAAPCRTDDLPMGTTGPDDTSAFDAALQTGAVGAFNLVVPNDCENGHDACGTRDRVRQFDDFLAREVPRIEASPAFGPDGTILITWDEGSDPPEDPGHVVLAALGPLVRPGAIDGARHDHYGLERTLAEGFGVRPLAHARTATALSSIWR